jgi:hypothetical protein
MKITVYKNLLLHGAKVCGVTTGKQIWEWINSQTEPVSSQYFQVTGVYREVVYDSANDRLCIGCEVIPLYEVRELARRLQWS